MGTWKRFWSLSRRDRNAALETAAVIVASRAGLRLTGYHPWKSLLSKLSHADLSASAIRKTKAFGDDDSPYHFARVAGSVARNLFFSPTCLERSCGLWWLLRRRGFDAELRIGGRKADGRFEAHAWVEYKGIPLNDAGDERGRFEAFGDSRGFAARELH